MTESARRRVFGCPPLVVTAVLLAAFGIVMQWSASSYSAFMHTGDEFFYVKKQVLAFVPSLACMMLFSHIKPSTLAKAAPWALVVSVAMLAAVFIPGLGAERYGATRWLDLGLVTIQPSEFAKFALVLFISATLADGKEIGKGKFALCAFAALAVCGLIMLEPNMSIAVLVALVSAFMLFAAGVKLRWFAALALPAGGAAALLIVLEPYRLKRLFAFLDPWASPLAEGYQLIQSYYALGSGGWFGVGLFNSRQKYLFLPFAESDFIFSVVGEELGLLGCICVLAAFCVLIYFGFRTAARATDRSSALFAAGVTAIIAFQVLLNVAVVTGSIPPTGLPMPLLSFGGSSLLVFMSAIGAVDGIARSQSGMLCHKL